MKQIDTVYSPDNIQLLVQAVVCLSNNELTRADVSTFCPTQYDIYIMVNGTMSFCVDRYRLEQASKEELVHIARNILERALHPIAMKTRRLTRQANTPRTVFSLNLPLYNDIAT